MNLDRELKNALKVDAEQIDALMQQDQSLFARIFGVWRGNMRWLATVVALFSLLATVLFIWCGYQFWHAPQVNDQIFWAVGFFTALIVQISLKMWLFMEANRNASLREIKRVEIELARLRASLQKTATK